MFKRLCSFALTLSAVVSFLFPLSILADRRPVEGRWTVEGARGKTPRAYPPTYHVLAGDELLIRFLVEAPDLPLYQRSRPKFLLPEGLACLTVESTSTEEVRAFSCKPEKPGRYDMELKLDSAEYGFRLSFPVRVVVHGDVSSIEKALLPPPPSHLCPDPAGVDADPDKNVATHEMAPDNYAHVHGLALSYAYPGNRRYMLRGLRLELRDGDTVLATVHTADPLGEGRCETYFDDYIDTTDNSYHHVTDSGSFDFGNIYVGASGKTLTIREVFQFYAGATGNAANGAHRFTTEEYGIVSNSQVYLDWVVTFTSGSEAPTWLMSDTFVLSTSNGSLGDEGQHVQIDGSRMYHFITECGGWSQHASTRFIIDLDDTDAPYHQTGLIYLNAGNDGYLQYPYCDTIRHEYAHYFHYRMRGDEMPDRDGGTNHGNCNNPNSVDALIEGNASYLATTVYWDGEYNWGDDNGHDMGACSDWCAYVPDDRHEWAAANGLWKSQWYSGAPDAFFGCAISAFYTWDPNDMQSYFNRIVQACPNDHETWEGFWCSDINYDTTPPDNPFPLACTMDPNGWTNDPTWSWLEPYDDLSGAYYYSISLVSGTTPAMPDDIIDISGELFYHPSWLPPDGPASFGIRAADSRMNWNSSFTGHTIYLDRIAPSAVTNLWHGMPPNYNQWSNIPSVLFSWTAAADDRSGLDGYSWQIVPSNTQLPDESKDLEEAATGLDVAFPSSSSPQYFSLRSKDNAGNWCPTAVHAGPFLIDTTLPETPTGFFSSTNPSGTWSNNTEAVFLWDPGQDAHSGVDGYSICADSLVCLPPATRMMGDVTSTTITLSHNDLPYYVSLRSVDRAENWGGYTTYGPVYIDTLPPGLPGNLAASHPTGIDGCTTGNPNFSVSWTPAYDGNSGIAAYSYALSQVPLQRPPETDMLPAGATNANLTVPYSPQYYIFTIMARDAAGNWGEFIDYGPFFSDRVPLPIGSLTLSLPPGMPGFLSIDWSGTGEAGYQVEFVTEFDGSTPDDWTDNAGYGEAIITADDYTQIVPAAPVVFYRVKGRNACGVLSGN